MGLVRITLLLTLLTIVASVSMFIGMNLGWNYANRQHQGSIEYSDCLNNNL